MVRVIDINLNNLRKTLKMRCCCCIVWKKDHNSGLVEYTHHRIY